MNLIGVNYFIYLPMLANSLYQEMFNLMPLPTVLLSVSEGMVSVVEANSAYLDLIGTTIPAGENFLTMLENEAENLNLYQFSLAIKKSLTKAIKTKKPNTIKLSLKKIEIHHTPLVNKKGDVEYLLHVIKPIPIQHTTEKLLSLLISNTEEAFIVLDKDLNITSFNAKFYELYLTYFGINIIEGESIMLYAQPNRRVVLKKLYQNVLKGKVEHSVIDIEYQNEIRKISIKYSPIADENQHIIGVFVAASDLTEITKFEQQLKSKEQELSLIYNNLNEVVFLLTVENNKKFKFASINKAFAKVSGLSEEQVIGSYVEEIIPEPSLTSVLANYKIAIESKKMVSWEETSQYPTGEKTAIVSVNPVFDTKGNCVELIGSVHDITERILAEQRFRSLVQEGSDMIGILDTKGKYLYVSPTSIPVLGMTPEEFIGKSAFDFIHPDDLENVSAKFLNLGIEKRIELSPFRFKHKNGTWRWIETVVTYMLDDPSIKGIVSNSRDVTDKLVAQKVILLSNERYKYVTKATSDAIWDWDLVTEELYWGEGFELLFGYALKDLAPDIRSWSDKIHKKDLKRVINGVNSVIDSEDQTNWKEEYWYLKADGKYAYVQDKGFVIRDEHGKAIRMVGAIQDISQRKKEEQQLKLLESVITNTNDSVLITEAQPIEGIGPRIIYVNNAFTKLTGYTADEVIGKTPRILQGKKTDRGVLDNLKKHLKNWEPFEAILLNYKKNGEEFWIHLSITPVADEKGWFTHWISIERDVTEQKNLELQKVLLADISQLFNTTLTLPETLSRVLQSISAMGNYCAAEIWLVDEDKKELNLLTKYWADEQMGAFYEQTEHQFSFKFGEGLPGTVWKYKTLQVWDVNTTDFSSFRTKAAYEANLKWGIGLPLFANEGVNGVLILGSREQGKLGVSAVLSTNFGQHLGAEIKRKQLEQELHQLFTFAPDIIATANFEGYFKKINPAACSLLEYTLDEFLAQPISNFIHPDDRESTLDQLHANKDKAETYYIENRYLTKSGRIKWLAWASNTLVEEGLIFSVAKDITEERNLSELLLKSNSMGKVGSWEIDIIGGTVYWSDITKEIRETEPGFIPTLETGIHYFKEGKDKETITQKVNDCKLNGTPWDEELQIVTFKGNLKWIRTIGQAEMLNGKCIRIYGSFQDIDERKKAELKVAQAVRELEESEKRYSDLFHLSPLPKWVYDVETFRFLDVNQTAIKHYGYSYEEFLNMTIKDIRPPEEWSHLEDAIKVSSASGEHFYEGVFIHQNKQGRRLNVEIKSNTIFFKGKMAKVIVANDITERISYFNALEQQNRKLQEISWIQSHIIRAPLSRLMGLVYMLKDKGVQTELSEEAIISHIEHSAEELDIKIREIIKKSDHKEI
ncbi:PAS domain S-box protein [Pedobacter sp. Du54]|uniref:PAS domain S-box protein n=1 Tax=Pedobacter anseongensis TaxID=3133439 RepID=UPI0030A4E7AF